MYIDECRLGFNIINSVSSTGELEYFQQAPPLFLFLTKIIFNIFGFKEQSFRLIPLCVSLISIPLMHLVSTKYFRSKFSIVLADLLFVSSPLLVFYARTFKPYSVDLLLALILLLINISTSIEKLNYKKISIFSIFCAFAGFISFPFQFLISSFLFSELCKNFNKQNCIKIFLIGLGASFSTIFCLTKYFSDSSTQDFVTDWSTLESNGFIDLNIHSIFQITANNLHWFFFDNATFIPVGSTSLIYSKILFFIALTGLFILSKENYKKYSFIFFNLLFIYIASFLRLYPFSERVVLYLLPFAIIIILKPFDFIISKGLFKNKFFKIIEILLLTCLYIFSFYPYLNNYHLFCNKIHEKAFEPLTDNPKYIINYICKNKSPNDEIVLLGASTPTGFFYTKYENCNKKPLILDYLATENPKVNPNTIPNFFNSLPRKITYWIYPMFCNKDYGEKEIIKYAQKHNFQYTVINFENSTVIKMQK